MGWGADKKRPSGGKTDVVTAREVAREEEGGCCNNCYGCGVRMVAVGKKNKQRQEKSLGLRAKRLQKRVDELPPQKFNQSAVMLKIINKAFS